jgi:hypothetical protein
VEQAVQQVQMDLAETQVQMVYLLYQVLQVLQVQMDLVEMQVQMVYLL